MTELAPGLTYRTFRAYDSQVHLLEVDLTQRYILPVLAAERFPFKRCYPVPVAIEMDALACVGAGYNLTLWHKAGHGVSDQPLHPLVVNGEIWTDGLSPGAGFLIGDGWCHVQQNRLQVHVWQDQQSWEVESVNLHHYPPVVAWTPRAPDSVKPDPQKHYAMIHTPQAVVESKDALPVLPPLVWKQNLGAEGVVHIVSGVPQIVRDGVNVCPTLNLDPRASNGPDNWWVRQNPRMALGSSADRRTAFLCTVEGRISTSKGVRLKQLANILVQRGVDNAVNMDGGGSAFMYTKRGGLVAPGCYNSSGEIDGLRPDHYATSVM